jgi:hypothetical protein
MLKIEYIFEPELNEQEKNPYLEWWTSANEGWSVMSPVLHDKHGIANKKTERSVLIEVGVNNKRIFNADDAIRVECLSYAKSSVGRPARIKSGTSYFYLKDAITLIREHGFFEANLELRVPNFSEDKQNGLFKGNLYVKVTMPASKATDWKFEAPTKYDLLPENDDFLSGVVYGYGNRTSLPFREEMPDESLVKIPSDYKFDPIEPNIGIHVPVIINEVYPTPIGYFWIDPHPAVEPEENFMLNVLQISLDRKKVSLEAFTETIDQQFASHSARISNAFLEALVIISLACSLISTSLPYIPDLAFTTKKKVVIESFHYAYRLKCGDCEDLGALAHRVARDFKMGLPEFRDLSQPYTELGGWKHPALKAVQKVLHYYVSRGPLGSVTSAYLGQDDKKKATLPIIIDSEQDKNVEIGFHIWNMLIPLEYEERLIKKTNPEYNIQLHQGLLRYPWETSLEVLVLEGTGLLFPLLKPYQEYFSGKDEKHEAYEIIEDTISMAKCVFIPQGPLRKANTERQQSLLKDVDHSRLSTFYRELMHSYTDEYIRKKYNVTEFTFMTIKKGVWYQGVNLRELIMKSENIGLLVTPGFTNNEARVVKSILRQLPPIGKFEENYKGSANLNATMKAVDEIAIQLKSKYMAYDAPDTREHKRKSATLNLYFSFHDFLDATFRKELSDQILSIDEIMHTKIAVEPIDKEVINIRFEIQMEIPSRQKLEELEEMRKKKKTSKESESEDEGEEEESE